MLDEFTSLGAVFHHCCSILGGYLRGSGRVALYIFFSFSGFGSFGFTGWLAFTRGVRRVRRSVGPAVAEIWNACRKFGCEREWFCWSLQSRIPIGRKASSKG